MPMSQREPTEEFRTGKFDFDLNYAFQSGESAAELLIWWNSISNGADSDTNRQTFTAYFARIRTRYELKTWLFAVVERAPCLLTEI